MNKEDAIKLLDLEINLYENDKLKDGWALLAAAGALLWLHLQTLLKNPLIIERYLPLLYAGYFIGSLALNLVVVAFPPRNVPLRETQLNGFFPGRYAMQIGRLSHVLSIVLTILISYVGLRVNAITNSSLGYFGVALMSLLFVFASFGLFLSYRRIVKIYNVKKLHLIFKTTIFLLFLTAMCGAFVMASKINPKPEELVSMLPGIMVIPLITMWLLFHDQTRPLRELLILKRFLLQNNMSPEIAVSAATILRLGAQTEESLLDIVGPR